MKDQRKTEIKVGATVVVGIIALILVFSWAKNYKIAGQKNISVMVESAAGLEKGDPVTVNGVRKGFVDDIEISGNSAIIKIVVDPEIKLQEDATFGVSMLDLMGGKKVEIKPGTSSKELDYTQMQKGVFYADIPAVMAMFGSVQSDLVNIIKDVQVTLSSMNKFLTDDEFNTQIRKSISGLTDITGKLNLMIDENRANFKTLTKNTTELTGEASAFIKDNKAQIKSTMNEVETVMQNTNSLLQKLNTLAEETQGRKNNLGKILYDETLVDDLKTSLGQVKELTKILIEQLKAEGINIDANIDLF